MDIQARKYNLIEYLIDLRDENLLSKLESVISSTIKSNENEPLKILTQEQVVLRANKSNEDYASGRFKSQEQLEEEAENW